MIKIQKQTPYLFFNSLENKNKAATEHFKFLCTYAKASSIIL